jgi:hypothetical protein
MPFSTIGIKKNLDNMEAHISTHIFVAIISFFISHFVKRIGILLKQDTFKVEDGNNESTE